MGTSLRGRMGAGGSWRVELEKQTNLKKERKKTNYSGILAVIGVLFRDYCIYSQFGP